MGFILSELKNMISTNKQILKSILLFGNLLGHKCCLLIGLELGSWL